MALIVPSEARESAPVSRWLDAVAIGNGPIREVLSVDVRQSMANGGGPACLRLRVVADPETIDPRFLLDEAKADAIEAAISRFYPEAIDPADLGSETLTRGVVQARHQLLHAVDLGQLG
jgi:succinylarginine dihydrolase